MGFFSSVARYPAFVGGWGTGKRIDIRQEIKTTKGWKRLSDIVEGDIIYGMDGRETKVLKAHPIVNVPVAYNLIFDSGEEILADPEHLWFTIDTKEKKRGCGGSIKTTFDIINSIRKSNDYETNHRIPVCRPVVGKKQELPIKPYTFGAWLGDGSSRESAITTEDTGVLDRIREDGYNIKPRKCRDGNIYHISNGVNSKRRYKSGGIFSNRTLNGILKSLGVQGNKRIPLIYMDSSIEQRMDLLRGLMDTDGCVDKRGGVCEFCSVREKFAGQVLELICSLGIKAKIYVGNATIKGRFISKSYRINFKTKEKIFSLARKQVRIDESTCCQMSRRTNRFILGYNIVNNVSMRCLTVDSSDGLFLVGRTFIATHNTLTAILKGIELSKRYPGNLGLILRKNYTDLRDCFDDQAEILTDGGWKFFDELTYKDKVLSMDSADIAYYANIDRIIKQKYKGVMRYYSGSVNFCVTPNHNLYIARPTSRNNKKSKTGFSFAKVQDISQKTVYFKKDFIWCEPDMPDILLKPSRPQAKTYKFKGDDWFEFLGWYISEGDAYFHKTHKTWWISIAQNTGENYDSIVRLLKRMGLKPTCVKGRIVFGSKSVGEHLIKNCGKYAPNKKIPDYLRKTSSRQIRIFLDSYRKGDGYIMNGQNRYNTSSRQLAGDIQELILKTGGYARVHIRDNRGRKSWIIDHWATTRNLDYLIIEQTRNHKSYDSEIDLKDVEDIFYDGMIYCVTAKPYHRIYVRRNGTCYWSGNSTLADFKRYTAGSGLHLKVQEKSVDVPCGKGMPVSKILFHHADELAGVIQNINLGWFYIEQAEEFDSDEVFQKLRGRLRREGTSRQGFLIANTNGHNWIWKLWKAGSFPDFELFEANTYDNAAHLPADFVADLREMEEQSPAHYRRYVLNSWEETDTSDRVIPYSKILDAADRDLRRYDGSPVVISCDPAEFGDDRSQIYVLRGYGVIDGRTLQKKELMETAGHILVAAQEHSADVVGIDDTGVGAGVRSRLREMAGEKGNFQVMPVSFGQSAHDGEHYVRLRDEIIMRGGQLFRDDYVSIPDDNELIEELNAFTYSLNSRGQMMVARKKDIKKVLGRSPDKAESLFIGLWCAAHGHRKDEFTLTPSGATVTEDYNCIEWGL